MASPAAAQSAPADRSSETLEQIDVTAPKRKPPKRRAPSGVTPTPVAAPAVEPAPLPPPRGPISTSDVGLGANTTPLNTNVVTESASRLGLTSRETPATVEVLDQQTLRDRGLTTTTDAVKATAGVTAGDAPASTANFSMRGFSESEINTLYNGIKVGPSAIASRVMDTGNLQQIEFLKGPASLLSGEGATGGAVNYVTKRPHTGPIANEAFVSYDSIHGVRGGAGSGGSTLIKGLDYRFDFVGNQGLSFIDDTYSKLLNISGQLDYRIRNDFKIWGAVERKEDKDRYYWGTPLVPSNAPGIVPTSGIVSGLWTQYYPNGHVGALNPVTVDARTLNTTYNVLDNRSGAKELWLRGGFDWDITSDVKLKSQVYRYTAQRHWFNNEVNAYNDDPTSANFGQVYRERLSVDHEQHLTGNITDLIWNANVAGIENRFAATFAASSLQFNVVQDDAFTSDFVNLVNPDRGLYGFQQTKDFFTHLNDTSISFEDRLKLTRQFALIGGIRFERITLSRDAYDVDGVQRTADGYPFVKSWHPTTGRGGYTFEPVPGLIFYSQYATGADPAIANIFTIRPTQPLLLTTSRTYETGMKSLFWDKRAEVTFSAYDIEKRNVYATKGGQQVEIAGKVHSKGIEAAAAVNPFANLKLWGNVAFVEARYKDFSFVDDNGVQVSYTGMTPSNVPAFVGNAGASYRFNTPWPIEIGSSLRRVSHRYNFDDNLVRMDAYTIADAYLFVDIPKAVFSAVDQTRLSFRVRNLTDKQYAAWGDPGYPDQIILGAPRSYEVAASFKW